MFPTETYIGSIYCDRCMIYSMSNTLTKHYSVITCETFEYPTKGECMFPPYYYIPNKGIAASAKPLLVQLLRLCTHPSYYSTISSGNVRSNCSFTLHTCFYIEGVDESELLLLLKRCSFARPNQVNNEGSVYFL